MGWQWSNIGGEWYWLWTGKDDYWFYQHSEQHDKQPHPPWGADGFENGRLVWVSAEDAPSWWLEMPGNGIDHQHSPAQSGFYMWVPDNP